MTYTKEQKAEYFKNLREQWKKNKELADQDEDARKKWEAVRAETPDFKISYYGFYLTLSAMQALKLDGLPYVDVKTFQGWRASGFKVKKGEKSKISGITWILSENKKKDDKENKDSEEMSMYLKNYALFHRSQVEPITK